MTGATAIAGAAVLWLTAPDTDVPVAVGATPFGIRASGHF